MPLFFVFTGVMFFIYSFMYFVYFIRWPQFIGILLAI